MDQSGVSLTEIFLFALTYFLFPRLSLSPRGWRCDHQEVIIVLRKLKIFGRYFETENISQLYYLVAQVVVLVVPGPRLILVPVVVVVGRSGWQPAAAPFLPAGEH